MALTLEQIKALNPGTRVRVQGKWFDDSHEAYETSEYTCVLWERKADGITAAIFPSMHEGHMVGTIVGEDGVELEEYVDVYEVLSVVADGAAIPDQPNVVFTGKCQRCGTVSTLVYAFHGNCCKWGGCNGIVTKFTATNEPIQPVQFKKIVLSGMRYDLDQGGFFACGFERQLGVALVVRTYVKDDGSHNLTPSSAEKLFEAGRKFPDYNLLRIESDVHFEGGPTYYVVTKSKDEEAFFKKASTYFNVNPAFRAHITNILNDVQRY